MKSFFIITSLVTSLFFINSSQLYAQNNGQGQFPISENGKFGCINDKGQVIIKPIFDNLGVFTEGVAPARLGGYFGFIDTLGQWTIAPQFEYATEFQEGTAIVFQKGKYFYINTKGQKLFDCSAAASLENFKNGVAFFTTHSQKKGVWTQTGRIIADTIFTKITPFHNGLAIVERELLVFTEPSLISEAGSLDKKGTFIRSDDKDKNKKTLITEVGIIDQKGVFIAPFGKYEHIETFQNGYFVFDIKTKESDKNKVQGILDRNGKEVFRHIFQANQSISTSFDIKKGVFVVNLYDEENGKKCDCLWSSRYSYQGLMNLKGEIVLENKRFERISYFDDTKIIAKGKDWEKFIVDWQGNPIKQANLEATRDYIAFDDDFEVVSDNLTGKKGIIDTNGNWLVKPVFKEEIDTKHYPNGFIFFPKHTDEVIESTRQTIRYSDSTEIEHFETFTLWGIANNKGAVLCEPKFLSYNPEGFKNGLLSVVFKDNSSGYVDRTGKTIWQQTIFPQKGLDTLNIDFMNRGNYYAASDSKSNDNRFGGWGGSLNKTKSTTLNLNFPPQKFSLQVSIKDTVRIEGKWLAYTVFIANLTSDTLFFAAEDSRLTMKMQAIDSVGKWRDIEFLPSSCCGNSYHTLALDPNAFWAFRTPQYKGVFTTRFRLELEYFLNSEKTEQADVLKIYSNEWSGSVNPSQFWRKKGYSASGLMDSYND